MKSSYASSTQPIARGKKVLPASVAGGGDVAGGRLPRIPDFRLIELCGRGGFGSVYLGVDRDGVRRAVRVLHSDERMPGAREREHAAIALYRNLAHGSEHLIDILYSGQVRATTYDIMPLADSASARQFRYRPLTLTEKLRGGCPLEEKLRIVRDVAEAVAFLHAHGVAHRDLKPENILFVDGVLKVADPGLLAPAHCCSKGGTRSFSPPYPRSGFRTDIYALGMIMYCVFTGLPPDGFPELPPDWNTGFHSKLNALILDCCRPDGGCQTIGEVVARLNALEVPAPRWSDLRRTWHRVRRSAELWLVILTLLFGFISCRQTERADNGAPPRILLAK